MAICIGKDQLPKAGDMVKKVEGLSEGDNCLDVHFTNGSFVNVHVSSDDVEAVRNELKKDREGNTFMRLKFSHAIPTNAVAAIEKQISDLLENHDAFKEFKGMSVIIDTI